MSKSNPQLRIQEIFEELVGHTGELKREFLDTYGMSNYILSNYYSGRKVTLDAHHADQFLEFFNKHKHPEVNDYVLSDMYKSSNEKSIVNKIGLS